MQFFTINEQVSVLRQFYLFLVDGTDGKTPELAEAGGQPQISINGAGFVPTAAVLVAVGNGSYYVALTQSEVATKGFLLVRFKSANTAEFQALGQVTGIELYRIGSGGS